MSANLADYYFMFATLGEMALKDVLAECQEQAWLPLLIIRPHDPNAAVQIPCFNTRENAIKFGKRNLPKNQLFGTVVLPAHSFTHLQQQLIAGRGWQFEPMNHPRLVKNIGALDIEVHELIEKPDVFGLAGKRANRSAAISYAL